MTEYINFIKHDSVSFSSFDMGDIEIGKDGVIISSKFESANSMMIFVAVSDFIFALKRVKSDVKKYEFIGADSSFCLNFERRNKGIVISDGINDMQMSWLEVFSLTMSGLVEIKNKWMNEFSKDDSVFQDLMDAENCLALLLRAEMGIS
ncbi:hypothetical protein E8K88_15870 [Lampropedia aestuarii]|uniref:Uncharacterized protein n=1 Tax=Lampropedia aestuarii TaxID=2562762 RepID=A0A4S5BGD7_9BURK|nr:hypothetical protein [Lampropedia aestuarii]THJ31119.1 hypothetical protein E8K88_15870 [Lampropedia aestuarii]